MDAEKCAKEDREGMGGVCLIRSQGLWGGVTRGFRGGGAGLSDSTDTGHPAPFHGDLLPAGGRLISLNHISLEGVTFSKAAEVMQSSPEEVQLIVSQPKGAVCGYCVCVCVCVTSSDYPILLMHLF